MSNHVLLDNATHRSLHINRRFSKGQGYDFNVARVFPIELSVVQREYPIFLLKNPESGDFDTIALLGFDEGENLFLGDDRWLANYIPLSMERQPFLIGFQDREVDGVPQRVPVVHVDMDHPSISSNEGAPVFLPQGGESPYLEHINSVLHAINEGHEAGARFSQALVGLELVESLDLSVEFDDGSKKSLAGLFTINEERLRSLPGAALETLNKDRSLQHIYMLLASLSSMQSLIQRKNESLRADA